MLFVTVELPEYLLSRRGPAWLINGFSWGGWRRALNVFSVLCTDDLGLMHKA